MTPFAPLPLLFGLDYRLGHGLKSRLVAATGTNQTQHGLVAETMVKAPLLAGQNVSGCREVPAAVLMRTLAGVAATADIDGPPVSL